MGVTLERVQNKFACIIGELSSEPDILSQFTIWVDLRIAEYKTKGTISLDCCGESPNPSWLRGFKLSPKPKDDQVSNPTDKGTHFLEMVTVERLSPEVVDESSDVYFTKLCRKRPASITAANTSSEEIDTSSPSKVNRTTTGASHTVEPVSESLISIIGSDTETNEPEHATATFDLIKSLDTPFPSFPDSSQSKGNNSGATESADNTVTTDLVSNSVVTVTAKKTVHQEEAGSSPTVFRVYPTFANKGHNSFDSSESNRALPTPSGSSSRRSASGLYPVNFPERLSNKVIRTRIVGYAQKPHNSTVNTVNAVGTLERWLWNRYDENRNIETIPPCELDAYLAEFFQILQKPNGLDYTADSMSNLRCSLERFLKDHMYPCSICKSQEFAKSRQVFTERRRSLASERFQMEKRCIEEEWNSKIQ